MHPTSKKLEKHVVFTMSYIVWIHFMWSSATWLTSSMHVTCVYSHGGDVFTREGIGGVTYQQTGLTHSPEGEGQ